MTQHHTVFIITLFSLMSSSANSKTIGKILSYDSSDKNHPIVSIQVDESHITEGMKLETVRLHQDNYIPTGVVDIKSTEKGYALAVITQQGSEFSQATLQPYAGIMIGDQVRKINKKITSTKVIFPHISVSYKKLFTDPLRNPQSYEMSQNGLEALAKIAKKLNEFRIETLIVKGFTDDQGTPENNQIESYQRASTVRQFLVKNMGFDPDRVVALGFGELEHTDHSGVGNYRSRNRRITFSIVRGSTSCLNCQKSKQWPQL
ncbi:MAG: OmpA family protein [Oligoflexales bacterium]